MPWLHNSNSGCWALSAGAPDSACVQSLCGNLRRSRDCLRDKPHLSRKETYKRRCPPQPPVQGQSTSLRSVFFSSTKPPPSLREIPQPLWNASRSTVKFSAQIQFGTQEPPGKQGRLNQFATSPPLACFPLRKQRADPVRSDFPPKAAKYSQHHRATQGTHLAPSGNGGYRFRLQAMRNRDDST